MGFILDQVGNVLDWTHDDYAAKIVRYIGGKFPF